MIFKNIAFKMMTVYACACTYFINFKSFSSDSQ